MMGHTKTNVSMEVPKHKNENKKHFIEIRYQINFISVSHRDSV